MAKAAVLIEQGGEIVEVNESRSALRVVGRTGAIVAHIPLNQTQLSRLAGRNDGLAAAE